MNKLRPQQQSTASSTVAPHSVSSSTVSERNWLPSTSAGPSSTSTAPLGELRSLEKPDQDQAKLIGGEINDTAAILGDTTFGSQKISSLKGKERSFI
ncbi:hypothetical protein P5673_011617 [Acropora cervicornis]|uniref:Uncharacterized protein n=1 Tax=Acropora cervicornis TaxID=6130 RepID=A0AAD9QPU1_ACRCE|nr:hypothetical protein P5673_011617 [Acropora cervicornis]